MVAFTMTAIAVIAMPTTAFSHQQLESFYANAQFAQQPQQNSSQPSQPFRTLDGHSAHLFSLIVSSDGQTLISSSYDKTIKFWNLATGELLHSIPLDDPNHWYFYLAVSPDGSTLASSKSDGTIQLWDLNTRELNALGILSREPQQISPGHYGSQGRLTFGNDGQTLVATHGSGGNFGVSLWNRQTETWRSLDSVRGWTDRVAFTPDGNTLAFGSSNGTTKVLNLRTGTLIQTLPQGASVRAAAIALSPDAQTLAIAHADGSIKLWNVRSARRILTLPQRNFQPTGITYSPNGRVLAIAGWNHIQLRNAQTGRLIQTLPARADRGDVVSFSPDGRTLINGSLDGRIQVWQVPSQ